MSLRRSERRSARPLGCAAVPHEPCLCRRTAAEEAIDGLIMNLHLCLALDLEPQAVQEIFGQRTLAFVLGMMAAAQTDSVSPRYSIDLACDLSGRRQFVETQIGTVNADGRLHIDQGEMNVRNDGTIDLVFRSLPGGRHN